MVGLDAATRPSSPPRIHPDDSRSIRPPGYPLACPRTRPAALARRKPPDNPPFSKWTERRSAGAPFVVLRPHFFRVETPLTRRCSFASVIDAKRKSRNRCFRPRSTRNWTLAGNAANTIFDAGGSERAREDPPFAGGDPSPSPRFLSSGERIAEDAARHRHTTPLVIVRWGRRTWRRSPSLQPLPLHDRRTFV